MSGVELPSQQSAIAGVLRHRHYGRRYGRVAATVFKIWKEAVASASSFKKCAVHMRPHMPWLLFLQCAPFAFGYTVHLIGKNRHAAGCLTLGRLSRFKQSLCAYVRTQCHTGLTLSTETYKCEGVTAVKRIYDIPRAVSPYRIGHSTWIVSVLRWMLDI